MITLSQSEIGTICYFLGHTSTHLENGELHEYFLEDDRIDHPSGDRLQVTEKLYVVTLADGTERYEFHRDFSGLVAALDKFTLQDA